MEKLNLTTKAHINQSKEMYYNTQNKHKKTKARFSRLLQQLAWKWRGPILVSAFYKFVTYLLTYLRRLLIYSSRSHTGLNGRILDPLAYFRVNGTMSSLNISSPTPLAYFDTPKMSEKLAVIL